jgi:hypothetical protein
MSAKKSVLAAVVIAALVACSTTTQADEANNGNGRLNNKTLKGPWGFKAHGFLGVTPASHLPASAMGRTVYDGAGTCTTEAKLNAGGTVIPLMSTLCTYFVNPDGTGQQHTVFGPAGDFTTDFVLVEDSKEFYFIVSDTNQPGTTVASGISSRQQR